MIREEAKMVHDPKFTFSEKSNDKVFSIQNASYGKPKICYTEHVQFHLVILIQK